MEVKTLQRKGLTVRIFSWTFIAIVLLGMIGLIVCIILSEINPKETLLWWLCFVFLGVVMVGVAGAIATFKIGERLRLQEEDAREKAVSEESFFAGERTMLTFCEKDLYIHPEVEEKGAHTVRVPYADAQLYVTKSRRSPRDKGRGNILLKIPAKYVSKGDKGKDAQPALIALEYKSRLLECIQKHGLDTHEVAEEPLPKPEKLFKVKLNSGIKASKVISVLLGVAMIVFAVVGGVLEPTKASIMTMVGVFGGFIITWAIRAMKNGETALVVYRDGVLWKEDNAYAHMYLRWAEIGSFSRFYHEKVAFVRFNCAYGSYYFPDVKELYESLCEKFPQNKEEKKR